MGSHLAPGGRPGGGTPPPRRVRAGGARVAAEEGVVWAHHGAAPTDTDAGGEGEGVSDAWQAGTEARGEAVGVAGVGVGAAGVGWRWGALRRATAASGAGAGAFIFIPAAVQARPQHGFQRVERFVGGRLARGPARGHKIAHSQLHAARGGVGAAHQPGDGQAGAHGRCFEEDGGAASVWGGVEG